MPRTILSKYNTITFGKRGVFCSLKVDGDGAGVKGEFHPIDSSTYNEIWKAAEKDRPTGNFSASSFGYSPGRSYLDY